MGERIPVKALIECWDEKNRDAEQRPNSYSETALALRLLAAEVGIAREYNKLRNAKRGSGVLADWQRRLSAARASTDAALDLGGGE